MDQIGAAALGGGNIATECGEVSRQNGRRELHGMRLARCTHLLTSREIASLPPT